MALETIRVVLSHDNVQQYLSRLDDRGEAYHFDVCGGGTRGKPIELELVREGSVDPMRVSLNPNGTWTTQHVVIIAEDEE